MNQESKQVTAPQKDANHILGKNWRPMSSRDIICRYIADHIAIIQEGKNLEIEIRLGTISFKAIKRVNPDVVYNTTHYLSHQNPMIIGSTYPFVQQALKFKGNCYSQEVSHRFNPTISETLFLSRI